MSQAGGMGFLERNYAPINTKVLWIGYGSVMKCLSSFYSTIYGMESRGRTSLLKEVCWVGTQDTYFLDVCGKGFHNIKA